MPIGTVPFKALEHSLSKDSLERLLIVPGMEPISWLRDRSRLDSPVRLPMLEGSVPDKLLLLRDRSLFHAS